MKKNIIAFLLAAATAYYQAAEVDDDPPQLTYYRSLVFFEGQQESFLCYHPSPYIVFSREGGEQYTQLLAPPSDVYGLMRNEFELFYVLQFFHERVPSAKDLITRLKERILEKIEALSLDEINTYKDPNGYSLLHWAVVAGFPEMAEKLLQKGVSVDARTKKKETPLLLLIKQMRKHNLSGPAKENAGACARALLKNGADPNVNYLLEDVVRGISSNDHIIYHALFVAIFEHPKTILDGGAPCKLLIEIIRATNYIKVLAKRESIQQLITAHEKRKLHAYVRKRNKLAYESKLSKK